MNEIHKYNNCILVANAVAFIEGFKTSPNTNHNTFDVYLKNSFVSLKTAQQNITKDVKFVLFVNRQVPEFYQKLFRKHNIDLCIIPFDFFNLGSNYPWSLAFYKLCVLKHLSSSKISKILLLDTDTVTHLNIDIIFDEISKNIMLYDTCVKYGNPEYNLFLEDFKNVYNFDDFPILYGGEFMGFNLVNLKEFINYIDKILNFVKDKNIVIKSGDEFFTSVAANYFAKSLVKNGKGYINRYWTGMRRIVPENSGYYKTPILHLPCEKQYGILRLFDLLVKGKKLNSHRIIRICNVVYGHWSLNTIKGYWKNKITKYEKNSFNK